MDLKCDKSSIPVALQKAVEKKCFSLSTQQMCRTCLWNLFSEERKVYPKGCWKDYQFCDKKVETTQEVFSYYDWTKQAVFCYEFLGDDDLEKEAQWRDSSTVWFPSQEYAHTCVGEDDGFLAWLKKGGVSSEYVAPTSEFVVSGNSCEKLGYAQRYGITDTFFLKNIRIFTKNASVK